MTLDTIIRGGKLVTADQTIDADLGIAGEKIAAITVRGETGAREDSGTSEGTRRDSRTSGSGDSRTSGDSRSSGVDLHKLSPRAKVIDAAGRYVLPGGLDVHVHLALPFCGTTSADDYDSGHRAAACGGVTTTIDFAIPYGDESLHQAVENWHAKAAGKACVDYTFHVAITKWAKHGKEIKPLVKAGTCGTVRPAGETFKQFMIYEKEGWQSDDAAIYAALETLRGLGGMLLVHAESSRVLDLLIERHHTVGCVPRRTIFGRDLCLVRRGTHPTKARRLAARHDPPELHRGRSHRTRHPLDPRDRRQDVHRSHEHARGRRPDQTRRGLTAGATNPFSHPVRGNPFPRPRAAA